MCLLRSLLISMCRIDFRIFYSKRNCPLNCLLFLMQPQFKLRICEGEHCVQWTSNVWDWWDWFANKLTKLRSIFDSFFLAGQTGLRTTSSLIDYFVCIEPLSKKMYMLLWDQKMGVIHPAISRKQIAWHQNFIHGSSHHRKNDTWPGMSIHFLLIGI